MTQKGFTAIELMVVISIAAILATLALPSFDAIIKKWQLNQAINGLSDAIYFARSEAVKYGGNVSIQKIPDSATCATGTSAEWSCGWQVVLNPIPAGATNIPVDGVLKIVEANEKNYITVPAAKSVLSLNRWGNPSAGYSIHVLHKRDGGEPSLDQYLCLSSGGRIRQGDSC